MAVASKSRIPGESGGIQINFCKNPNCANFGVAALQRTAAPRLSQAHQSDNYRIAAAGSGYPVLRCVLCKELPPIKSNLAVHEELDRMLQSLSLPAEPSCPDNTCVNYGFGVSTYARRYQRFGQTAGGSIRYRCKACKRLFTQVRRSTLRQRQSDRNEMVFRLLVNKSPMRRICEVAGINAETLYQRIDFFAEQCRLFAAARENLLPRMKISRLNIAVDRQEYIVNWSDQSDRRNIRLGALASADMKSGYVFGMHLNFDPRLMGELVNQEALVSGDTTLAPPFRRYARVWLNVDYQRAMVTAHRRRHVRALGRRRAGQSGAAGVERAVLDTYADMEARDDVETDDIQTPDTQLPTDGMQLHSEYTMYGHFFYLAHLFQGAEKIRFYLDQESGIRAACLAAFHRRVKAREIDAFYVSINKDLTINERRRAKADAEREFAHAQALHQGLSLRDIELKLIQDQVAAMATIGKWSDRWLRHPFPSMSEPEKAVCYLTDYGDYAPERLARLYQRASLHAIDRYFMQLRRRVSLLERPIATSSSQRRMWHGYSPYKPAVAAKVLTIFRTFYNYIQVGEDGKTPAMRLGLLDRPATIHDVIDYVHQAVRDSGVNVQPQVIDTNVAKRVAA